MKFICFQGENCRFFTELILLSDCYNSVKSKYKNPYESNVFDDFTSQSEGTLRQ